MRLCVRRRGGPTLPGRDPGFHIPPSHARLWADLAAQGTPIGAHDHWLAATCISRGLTLATGNPRDFGRVPGLAFEVCGPGE